MGRVLHFEIHGGDMERAKKFYGEIFEWTFEEWSAYAGIPYFGAETGNVNDIGINGALVQRGGALPGAGKAERFCMHKRRRNL